MDSLKLIPSVFFDAIARVVPGATGIVAYLLISGRTWSEILEHTLGPSFSEHDSVLTATALLFFCAYVVGQLIAPLAKLAQRIGEWPVFKPKPEAPKDAYDYLRLYYKDAGSQCAKIRAEFTMYNGLVIVLFVGTVCYLVFKPHWDWLNLIFLLVGTIGSGIRGRTTRDTFEGTVRKFVDKTPFPKPPVGQQAAAPNGSPAMRVDNSGGAKDPSSVS
jgi:hypothetical protein